MSDKIQCKNRLMSDYSPHHSPIGSANDQGQLPIYRPDACEKNALNQVSQLCSSCKTDHEPVIIQTSPKKMTHQAPKSCKI